MKRRHAVLALLSLSTFIASSIPARAAEFAPGTIELSIAGTFDHQSLSESGGASATLTTANVNAGVGGFATSLLEVNWTFTLVHQSVDFGRDHDRDRAVRARRDPDDGGKLGVREPRRRL